MSLGSAKDHAPTRLRVLAVLTIVLVLAFTPLAIITSRQAWVDWHAVPAEGVVAGVRFMRVDRPAPRATGPWHVVWEVECGPDGPDRVSVTAPGSYRVEADAETASRKDPGKRVTVWHVPGDSGSGSLQPPDLGRGLFAAIWTTALATIGWLGVIGLAQRGWQRFWRKEEQVMA